jgi:hypothetical protein
VIARATLGSLLPARENQRTFTRSAARAAFLLFAAVLVLLVVPVASVDASIPTTASTTLGRPALAEASAGLAPSRLGELESLAGDELAHDAPRFGFASGICLPALALLERPELGSLELPAQSHSAPLAPPESSRSGHTIYGGWECGCERTYALNNPLKYVDPDGRIVETPWDWLNVTWGAASFTRNVATGNWVGAAVDGVGLLYDFVATATPGLPAGAASATRLARLARSADKLSDIGKAANELGDAREALAAFVSGGRVVNDLKLSARTAKGLESVKVDVIGGAGELITVGGGAKSFNMGEWGDRLRTLRDVAAARGVKAQAYLDADAPEHVIKLAEKWLGKDNVRLITIE